MKVGIDLQHMPQFEDSYRRTGEAFLEKIFTKAELNSCERAINRDIEYLCGRFCLKEAAIKAGLINIGEWYGLELIGEIPVINGAEVSLSHSGDYCIAIVVLP